MTAYPWLGCERTCEKCYGSEERVFRDSYTGKELCLQCLAPIIEWVTNSPATEGDNLERLLEGE